MVIIVLVIYAENDLKYIYYKDIPTGATLWLSDLLKGTVAMVYGSL